MYCNRCGNQIEPNSQFCTTCGNAITPTVVPQTNPTVVPTNGTVVPNVEQGKSSVTITSIIVVLVVFIGAGIVGILMLKNTKANVQPNNETSQIAIADPTETTKGKGKTEQRTWATTTTAQRVDVEEVGSSYTLNGLRVNIPEGFTPSYSNDVLTVMDSTGKNFYFINVVNAVFETIDPDKYQAELVNQGYTINNFEKGTFIDRPGLYMTVKSGQYEYNCYLLKATGTKVTVFLFQKNASQEFINEIVNYSFK